MKSFGVVLLLICIAMTAVWGCNGDSESTPVGDRTNAQISPADSSGGDKNLEGETPGDGSDDDSVGDANGDSDGSGSGAGDDGDQSSSSSGDDDSDSDANGNSDGSGSGDEGDQSSSSSGDDDANGDSDGSGSGGDGDQSSSSSRDDDSDGDANGDSDGSGSDDDTVSRQNPGFIGRAFDASRNEALSDAQPLNAVEWTLEPTISAGALEAAGVLSEGATLFSPMVDGEGAGFILYYKGVQDPLVVLLPDIGDLHIWETDLTVAEMEHEIEGGTFSITAYSPLFMDVGPSDLEMRVFGYDVNGADSLLAVQPVGVQ